MRSAESIACSLNYIANAPDLSPEVKRHLAELVKVLNIEVTTINFTTTYVVDFSQGTDTLANVWLSQMPPVRGVA